jgi:hypothetical protein
MSFTCPRCGAVSHHPKDEEHGYCAACHEFTGDPTLQQELTALFELRRAADQMAIAQWRGAHPGNDLVIPDHADLVIWLLDQLASYQRLDRVDTALAKRFGDHIRRDSELRVWLDNWLSAYPLDVFPEPDLKKARELLEAGGLTLDSVSADMARHVLKRVIERICKN